MTLSITQLDETNVASQDRSVVLFTKGVSKKYCRDLKRSLFYGVQDIAGEMTGLAQRREKPRKKEFWALKDVSFELRRGEALGLVGKNGSGKSTLLRIIAGLIKPDIGSVEVNGRVAPLIALGAGFNPILTGRENIYANMSILGLSKSEIDDRFDQVLDFAEIGDAIDAPVQSYSSGMAARLGFASAIYTKPDILLIDEVLAVGDIRFRAKCNRRLSRLREQGTSFILVSHNSQSILSICERAIYLQQGKVVKVGKPEKILAIYEANLFVADLGEAINSRMILKQKAEAESTGLDIKEIFFLDSKNEISNFIETGKPITLCIKVNSHNEFKNIFVRLIIKEISGEGEISLTLSNQNENYPFQISLGENELVIHMPYVGLKPAAYSMKIILKQGSLHVLDIVESFNFIVKGDGKMGNCMFYQPIEWYLKTLN